MWIGGGASGCIKAGYFKMGWTNFVRTLQGKNDGFKATGIIEVYEDMDGPDEGQGSRGDGEEHSDG